MKNITFSFLVLFVLVFSSCLKEHNELVPELEGIPAGGMTGVTIKSIEDNVLTLEMSLFVVDHFGGFVSGLSANNFSVIEDGINSNANITGLSESEAENRGPFSATLLFDQSGSITGNDPNDARIEAGTSFANLVGSGDEGSITAFSQGGSYFQSPYEVLTSFTTDKDVLTAAIENLQGKTGGYTPLYKSVFDMIPYTKNNGANENRAIIAFTDGEDTEGGVTTNAIIQAACANGINIYTVGLGNSVNTRVLSEIAFETGGAVMLAEDAIQLVALYSSLGDLLHGEGRFYNLQMEISRTGGSWSLNEEVSGTVMLPLSEDITINFPYELTLGLQEVGEWYDRLPACPCTYREALDLVERGCNNGTWEDCMDASMTFHYGASFEVRWYDDAGGLIAGQQCTYSLDSALITSGIAAGSPDMASPRTCANGTPDWLVSLAATIACFSDHCELDVEPWEEDPCHEYLRDWPANNANGCAPNNPVTDIQHILNVVGNMTCEEVTILFMTIDENLAATHNLRRFFHREISFYSTSQIIADLNALADDLNCNGFFDSDGCSVIETALGNL